ncbi:hypothetical protein Lfu02_13980 [Longispora fulva]|uniref:Uncharacterized protein n=1 Tax=Longispora fulva TaxID=619741 RepID=A0A8J7KTC7_9ACTN|nr:hypothetical protein [Longispora fulva]MBG6140592.1 hypothetical protein [Longispora fulva]GIG57026.1 hypothetical protein Lfu02_13980 [Longispora fulva]
MSSETERNEPDHVAGFGSALGLADADAPAVDPNASFRTRLALAVGSEGRRGARDFSAPPPQRILAAVSVWAFVLALGGIVVGLAALVRIIAGAPGWFEPVIILVGILGMGFTVAGFVTVNRALIPWAVLGAGTLTLIVGAILTASA